MREQEERFRQLCLCEGKNSGVKVKLSHCHPAPGALYFDVNFFLSQYPSLGGQK